MSNVPGPGAANPFFKLGMLASLSKLPDDLVNKLKSGTFTEADLQAAEALLQKDASGAENSATAHAKAWIEGARSWMTGHGTSNPQDLNVGHDFLSEILARVHDGGPSTAAVTGDPNPPVPADQKGPICPVLAALGLKGKVDVKQFQELLRERGFDETVLKLLGPIAEASGTPSDLPLNFAEGKFDIDRLPLGLEKHPSDSQILAGGVFHQDRFDKLATFAETRDGKKIITSDSLAKFIQANTDRDVKVAQAAHRPANELDAILRGGNASAVEFGALLASFGQRGPDGKQFIAVDDLLTLFRDHKLPATGEPNMLNFAGTVAKLQAQVNAGYVQVYGSEMLHQIGTSTPAGQAMEGIRLAVRDMKDPADQKAAALMLEAMGVSSCPYMSGGAGMTTQAQPGGLASAHAPGAEPPPPATAPDWQKVQPH